MKPETVDAPPAISAGDHRTAPRLAFELLESKFHPPVLRPGIVARTALVDRLAAAQAPVIAVVPRFVSAVLGQIRDILQQRPDLGVLPALAGELQSGLAKIKAVAVGASSLTAAELRLLPLLSTHLSFREIGERLHLSSNTVKTQAYSVYRKLGVSSRSGAVTRTRELGLDGL